MDKFQILAQTTCTGDDSAVFMCEAGKVVDIMSYIAIGLAVASVAIVGFLLIFSVAGNNSNVAAHTIRKIFFILIGLIVVFSAPRIAGLAIT